MNNGAKFGADPVALKITATTFVCIGGIVFFYQTRASRNWNPLVHVVVPAIGAIVFGAALYGSVHPAPPGILKWTPYLGLAWERLAKVA